MTQNLPFPLFAIIFLLSAVVICGITIKESPIFERKSNIFTLLAIIISLVAALLMTVATLINI